ncbi:MAG: hypothetical protein ACREMA_12675 [Longimicrobiales bacterium]
MRRTLWQSDPVDGECSDEEVIRDEDKFRRRFGPGFRWNRRDRIGLIELKQRYDLTDPEIRLFQHTGNLRRTPFGVSLTASPWVALWGALQLGVFALLFLALLLAALPNFSASLDKAIKPALVLLFLMLLCVGLYWMFIKPWVIQRQRARQSGGA